MPSEPVRRCESGLAGDERPVGDREDPDRARTLDHVIEVRVVGAADRQHHPAGEGDRCAKTFGVKILGRVRERRESTVRPTGRPTSPVRWCVRRRPPLRRSLAPGAPHGQRQGSVQAAGPVDRGIDGDTGAELISGGSGRVGIGNRRRGPGRARGFEPAKDEDLPAAGAAPRGRQARARLPRCNARRRQSNGQRTIPNRSPLAGSRWASSATTGIAVYDQAPYGRGEDEHPAGRAGRRPGPLRPRCSRRRRRSCRGPGPARCRQSSSRSGRRRSPSEFLASE